MTERFRLKVGLTNLPTCQDCPIPELHFNNKTATGRTIYDAGTNTCRIAVLEKKLGRIPTFKEVKNAYAISGSVYWFKIPPECPNKYLNPDNIPASNRKK